MHCPRCAKEALPDAAFCTDCGCALTVSCPGCQRRWSIGIAFCADCGTRLDPAAGSADGSVGAAPSEGERRIATVLLSDLSGYTAMNESLDPEEVAEILAEIKETATQLVESHGGIVNQFVGDQITALFGVPAAQDDDPRRAVAAALGIHEAVRSLAARRPDRTPLSMHTAIETGLVVAQRRDERDGRYAITGEAMDRANELIAGAVRDRIVVGAATHPLIAPYFQCETKPGAGAVEVVAERGARSRFEAAQARGLTPLTGRRYELERLLAAYRDTCEGRGHLISVVGEPGVGKSRLLHEFRHAIDPAEAFVFHGRCQSFGGVTAYLPFLQAFGDALGTGPRMSSEQVAERIIRSLTDLDPELTDTIPIFLQLFSASSDTYPLPPELKGEALPGAIQDAIVAVNRRLSVDRPVVLHLEDWHWADEASNRTLIRLAREIADARILIVVDSRPHQRARFGAFESELLRLQPLTAAEVENLIRACLGAREVDPALAAAIGERTGGNPLFVEELCTTLVQQDSLHEVDGALRPQRPLDSLALPETVQSVVRSRIDRLGEPARELLRVASVVGREFPDALIQRLAASGTPVTARLDELERLELLQPWPAGGEPGWRFKHVITQEVAYETLLRQKRRSLHREVAEALEQLFDGRLEEQVEALARHYSQSGDDDKAIDYSMQAGRKAARRYALGQARRHYRAVIERIDPASSDPARVAQRIAAVLRWAEVCIYDPALEQLEHLRSARAAAERQGNGAQVLRCDYWISWIYYAVGDQKSAIEGMSAAVETVRPLGDDELLGQMLCNLAQCHVIGRDHDRARTLLEEGTALRQRAAEKGGYEVGGTYGYSLAQLGLLEADAGNLDASARWFGEALATVRHIGRRSAEGSILSALSIAQTLHGDHASALVGAREVRRIAEHMTAPYLEANADALEGAARFHAGEREAGIRLMRHAIRKLDECGAFLTMAFSLGCLAEGLALTGSPEEARQHAERALARASAGDRLGDGIARRALALAAVRGPGGSLERARTLIDEARRAAVAGHNEPERLLADLFAAEIEGRAGDWATARRILEAIAPRLAELEMHSYAGRARELLERAV